MSELLFIAHVIQLNGKFVLTSVLCPIILTVLSVAIAYGSVYKSYIFYTLKHYGAGSTVVFDGYDNIHQQKSLSIHRLLFDDDTLTSTSQGAFLATVTSRSE